MVKRTLETGTLLTFTWVQFKWKQTSNRTVLPEPGINMMSAERPELQVCSESPSCLVVDSSHDKKRLHVQHKKMWNSEKSVVKYNRLGACNVVRTLQYLCLSFCSHNSLHETQGVFFWALVQTGAVQTGADWCTKNGSSKSYFFTAPFCTNVHQFIAIVTRW